jgi:hypothetical protein
MWLAYIGLGITILLFVGCIATAVLAYVLDWYHYRKNRLWIEIQKDHNQHRRPAAK